MEFLLNVVLKSRSIVQVVRPVHKHNLTGQPPEGFPGSGDILGIIDYLITGNIHMYVDGNIIQSCTFCSVY